MKSMKHRKYRVVALLLCLLAFAGREVRANQTRLWMASQNDYGAQTGFYLDFENSTPGTTPCPLSTLKLFLAVGDGTQWHFLPTAPAASWQFNHDYTVVATITPQGSHYTLDGAPAGQVTGGWKPAAGQFLANFMPSWAQDPADYLVLQKSLAVSNTGGQNVNYSFAASAAQPLVLQIFQPQAPIHLETWSVGAAQSLTVTAVFRIVPRPADLHSLAPAVDQYGQAAAADWIGKIHTDADLAAATQQESRKMAAWTPVPGTDAYGGSTAAGWRVPKTGFYGVTRHNNVWWMISPLGNPLFYSGLDTAPALTWDKTPVTGREYLFASLPPNAGPTAAMWASNVWGQDPGTDYLAMQSVNMLHKYGPNWQQTEKTLTAQRLGAWGFTGLGKFADGPPSGLPPQAVLPNVPDIPVLYRSGVPTLAGGHPDIFDPAVRSTFQQVLSGQITPRKADPLVVGWSVGNEYAEIITPAEIQGILGMGAAVPAKVALTDYFVDTLHGGSVSQAAAAAKVTAQTRADLYAANLQPSAGDAESLRLFFADRYYDYIYKTVKSLDPNHLYLGFWISIGWWVNENDWYAIAKHCDVVGYDRYTFAFADTSFARQIRQAGKPVLCGEFSFPSQYNGARGYGAFSTSWTQSDAESGTDYAQWVRTGAANPYCVGICWFQYRDEPLAGRGPGHGDALVLGEDYAEGMVDVTDRPKWDLVTAARNANRQALNLHLKAVGIPAATRTPTAPAAPKITEKGAAIGLGLGLSASLAALYVHSRRATRLTQR